MGRHLCLLRDQNVLLCWNVTQEQGWLHVHIPWPNALLPKAKSIFCLPFLMPPHDHYKRTSKLHGSSKAKKPWHYRSTKERFHLETVRPLDSTVYHELSKSFMQFITMPIRDTRSNCSTDSTFLTAQTIFIAVAQSAPVPWVGCIQVREYAVWYHHCHPGQFVPFVQTNVHISVTMSCHFLHH